jgi:hypothetical protein
MATENIIQHKRATKSKWTELNYLLLEGEVGYEKDTGRTKIGNGVTTWNDLPYENAIPTLITVGTSNCDFTSVVDALNSITDASPHNPYVINVMPGKYTESQIVMKEFVSIIGTGTFYNTSLQATNDNEHFIIGAGFSELRGLGVHGPGGVGQAAIYYGNTTNTARNYPFKVIDVCISKGYYGVYALSTNAYRTKVHCFNVVNYYIESHTASAPAASGIPNTMFRVEGNANLTCMSCAVMSGRGTATSVPIGWHVLSTAGSGGKGAELTLDLCSAYAVKQGLKVEGVAHYSVVGDRNSSARLSACSFTNGTGGIDCSYGDINAAGCVITDSVATSAGQYHINIDANSKVSYSGVANKNRIQVATGGKLSASFTDSTLNEEGQVVFGELWLGTNKATAIPLKDYGITTYVTGWVSGGECTNSASAMCVDVAAGSGYVNDGSGVYKVTWDAITKLLDTDIPTQYIYVDNTGVVNVATAEPDYKDVILLAAVDTNDTDVVSISNHRVPIKHYIASMAEYLEEVVGPISVAGGGVSVSVSGSPRLDVVGGEFYRIFEEQIFNGGTSIPLFHVSRGTGNYNYGASTVSADCFNYDSAIDTLTSIPSSAFVKHALYVVLSSDGTEYYQLVYGRTTFASKTLAENGGLPTAPDALTKFGLRLAGIVCNPVSGIVSVTNELPKLGQMASSVTTITDHNDLSGRDSDIAHPQYAKKADGVIQQIQAINSTGGTSNYSSGSMYFVGSGLADIQYNGASIIVNASNPITSYVKQVNGLSGSVQLVGSDNVTVSTNNGSIVVQGKTDFPYIASGDSANFMQTANASLYQQTANMSNYQPAGNYLTTAAQSDHYHSINVQGNIAVTQGTGTISLSVPAQTVQPAVGSLNGSSGTMSIIAGGAIGLTNNASTISISAPTQTIQPAVGQLNGSSGTMTVSGGTNITISNTGNIILIQGATIPVQSQMPSVISFNGTSGSLSLAVGSSLSSSVNGASTTFGLASNITTALQSANANYLTNQTVQPAVGQLNGSSGTVTVSGGNNITISNTGSTILVQGANQTNFVLSASNGIQFGTNGSTVTASYTVPTVPAQTIQTANLSFVGNTVGESSSSNYELSGLAIKGTGNISIGNSAGSLIFSVPVGGGAGDGYNILEVGGAGSSLSTTYYMNSNTTSANGGNVVFGLSGNTITGSYADPDGWSILGNTAGTNTYQMGNSNGTMYLEGGNNITLSGNGSTLQIIGGAGNILTYLTYENRQLGASGSTQFTNNQIWMAPFRVNGGYISASTLQYLQSLGGTYTSAVAATHAQTMNWCVYSNNTTNSTALQSMTSGSFTWQVWTSGPSSASAGTGVLAQISGVRMIPIPYGTSLSTGLYVMAFRASSSTAGYSGLLTRYGFVVDSPMPLSNGYGFGTALNTSVGFGDAGTYSVTSTGFPSSIGFSEIRQHSNLIPYFKFGAI